MLLHTLLLASAPLGTLGGRFGSFRHATKDQAGRPLWADATTRISAAAGAARKALFKERRRKLMDVEAKEGAPSVFIVNDVEVDVAPFNCPAEWTDMLDPGNGCLPWQPTSPTSATQALGWRTPGNKTLVCGSAGLAGCAAADPFGADPICAGVIDDCTFSKKGTRGSADGDPHAYYPKATHGKCSTADANTQWLDCGIPCPAPFPMSNEELGKGYGVAVLVFLAMSSLIGVAAYLRISKQSTNYFVAGRSLPLFVVAATLGSQSLDSNAALGNIDLGYRYHWWDGAVLPIGLGLSLILNAIFFASKLNKMELLTLPDLFRRSFGPCAEVMFSLLSITSFLMLLGGNLVGSGRIIAFVFGLNEAPGVWITCFFIWLYTVAGGLFSVAYTDVLQAGIGWLGLVVGVGYVLSMKDDPDGAGDGTFKLPGAPGISPAYPLGDQPAFTQGMADADSYDPIPNALVFNWATIFVLGFGNLAALDFQARVFASKTPKIAVIGCVIGGLVTWAVGISLSFMTGAIRATYGPSSPHAEFVADSCAQQITVIGCYDTANGCNALVSPGVPTCGEWKPDPYGPLKFLTCSKPECNYVFDYDGSAGMGAGAEANFPMNGFIGGWVLLSIVAASMSTGDGAILAMGTVFSHNLVRKLGFVTDKSLLTITRVSTVLWASLGGLIASALPGVSGYLLVVAFDIMLAGCVVPMFAAVYWKPSPTSRFGGCKPLSACLGMAAGSLTRLVLEFGLPKDGLLLLLGKNALSFGAGIYDLADLDVWFGVAPGSVDHVCPQHKLKDFTGIDSLISPVVSLLVLLAAQALPASWSKHPWLTPVPKEKDENPTRAAADTEMSKA